MGLRHCHRRRLQRSDGGHLDGKWRIESTIETRSHGPIRRSFLKDMRIAQIHLEIFSCEIDRPC